MSSRKDGDTMNRLMRVTLLTFVVSLVVWGLVASHRMTGSTRSTRLYSCRSLAWALRWCN
jgi:hypothetical protein